MDRAALLDLVTEAVARAQNHEPGTEWDREAAQVAVRRWQPFGRRSKADSYEARVRDLARGLIERLDPERMDDPGWHVWTAEAAGKCFGSTRSDPDSASPDGSSLGGIQRRRRVM